VHDLQVAFGGLRVLEGLSFAAPRGEITGLVGPNGAGKSTVLNVVSGFVPAQRGRIELGGVDLSNRSAHERAAAGIGRTFQLVGLAKSLSVRDNLLLAQHLRAGYPAAGGLVATPRARRVENDLRRDAEASARALGFGDRLDRRLGELSHGQQRIVEIACALSTRPQVLLLDEPTAGLSPKAVEALAVALTRLRDELGQTVVVVEHHLAFVSATCAEVLVLADGSLLSHGPPEHVLAEQVVVDAYLGGVA
jgi:branched-chain amino acid transport system ATP-binding protein